MIKLEKEELTKVNGGGCSWYGAGKAFVAGAVSGGVKGALGGSGGVLIGAAAGGVGGAVGYAVTC